MAPRATHRGVVTSSTVPKITGPRRLPMEAANLISPYDDATVFVPHKEDMRTGSRLIKPPQQNPNTSANKARAGVVTARGHAYIASAAPDIHSMRAFM